MLVSVIYGCITLHKNLVAKITLYYLTVYLGSRTWALIDNWAFWFRVSHEVVIKVSAFWGRIRGRIHFHAHWSGCWVSFGLLDWGITQFFALGLSIGKLITWQPWEGKRGRWRRWKPESFNLILEMTSCHFCIFCSLATSHWLVQPTLNGKGLQKSMNTREDGVIGIFEAAYHSGLEEIRLEAKGPLRRPL